MTGRQPAPPKLFLQPGEYCIATEPTVVTTVLGSCVSLTMFHRRTRSGGICHARLPTGGGSGLYRFVDGAIYGMLGEFRDRGIPGNELEVKLFGGAELMGADPMSAKNCVGRQNVEAAQRTLAGQRLRLRASVTGGAHGCKIAFYTHTGEVLLQRLGERPKQHKPSLRRAG